MKIFYLANARIPTEKAHGVQIMEMCQAFARAGNEVELVVPRRRNTLAQDPFVYYGIERNFRITWLPTLDLVSWGKVGFVIQLLSFSILSYIYIRGHVRRGDLVYSRDELPLLFISFLRHVRFIWEAHRGSYNWIVGRVARYAHRIVVISEGLRQRYADRGVQAKKLLVAHDGVDLMSFSVPHSKAQVRERFKLPQESSIVMYIGRLEAWKGIDTLLEASRQLDEAVTVAVIGGDPHTIERYRSEYPNVRFLGYRPYRELPLNQQAADVLVIPNSSKDEISRLYTSPLKLFAHMASGIPIVASDLPSLREILNESNAYFAIPDNPASLARAIRKALEDKEGSRAQAAAAKRDVRDFDWSERAQKILMSITS